MYADYYNNDAHNAASGAYEGLLNAFAIPAMAAPAAQAVSSAVFASVVIDPQALILLIMDADHPDGWVTLYHRLQRFEPHLGHATTFDNKSYAFFSNVVSRQVPPMVEWPENAFHQIAASV